MYRFREIVKILYMYGGSHICLMTRETSSMFSSSLLKGRKKRLKRWIYRFLLMGFRFRY